MFCCSSVYSAALSYALEMTQEMCFGKREKLFTIIWVFFLLFFFFFFFSFCDFISSSFKNEILHRIVFGDFPFFSLLSHISPKNVKDPYKHSQACVRMKRYFLFFLLFKYFVCKSKLSSIDSNCSEPFASNAIICRINGVDCIKKTDSVLKGGKIWIKIIFLSQ